MCPVPVVLCCLFTRLAVCNWVSGSETVVMNTTATDMNATRERIYQRLADRGDRLWERMQDADEQTRVRLGHQLADVDRMMRQVSS